MLFLLSDKRSILKKEIFKKKYIKNISAFKSFKANINKLLYLNAFKKRK